MNELSLAGLLAPDSLFRNAVLGGLLVTTLCATLGVYVALRRIVLVGVALPQVAAAGVALVFWLTGHGHGEGDGAHALARLGALAATFAALAYLLPRRGNNATPV
jgi:ABC-type Mn2+/Zn2+ transport system permease subunit